MTFLVSAANAHEATAGRLVWSSSGGPKGDPPKTDGDVVGNIRNWDEVRRRARRIAARPAPSRTPARE